nr:MAG: ORF1 [TTV-like mini virus]
MPWYNYRRRYYKNWRRRRRWRRPRRFIPRRFYRRRYWVRRRPKRKLKSIIVRQFQPPCIRKLKIEGHYPLFITTHERLSNDLALYLDSTAPKYVPGGGGFSIYQFTLRSLFDLHIRLRNWWTHSNDTLPLIRYTGCTIKLFKNSSVDYIATYNNNIQTRANRLLFASTQPSIMALQKHRKIVTCKQYNKKTKPYTKIKIRPPPQLTKQWYFQHDLVDTPLFTLMVTAASLDRWYLASTSVSTSIGLTTLNCNSFQYHNFKAWPTAGYKPQEDQYIYGIEKYKDIKTVTAADLIYLGNTNTYQLGYKIKDSQTADTEQFENTWNRYFADNKRWGNPFCKAYFTGTERQLLITNYSQTQLRDAFKSKGGWQAKVYEEGSIFFTYKTTPNIINCRYNPYHDKGAGNSVYILKLNNPNETWDPPVKPELIGSNLPLWCLCWGYLDYQRKAAYEQDIDVNCIFVVKTKYIDPVEPAYVFLDKDFLNDTSPYRPKGEITPSDLKYWHPKISTQVQSVNEICACGPGTVKLPEQRSVEASMVYKFYFKLGGDPPPMELVTDPEKQPKWPLPSNLSTIPSLQSPATAIGDYLYRFDQRGDFLTKAAITRLKKDKPPKETLLPITGASLLDIRTESPQTSDTETSESEKEEQTLEQQLHRHRRNQKQLRRGIKQLLMKISKLE